MKKNIVLGITGIVASVIMLLSLLPWSSEFEHENFYYIIAVKSIVPIMYIISAIYYTMSPESKKMKKWLSITFLIVGIPAIAVYIYWTVKYFI